jgi:hypothetical protein
VTRRTLLTIPATTAAGLWVVLIYMVMDARAMVVRTDPVTDLVYRWCVGPTPLGEWSLGVWAVLSGGAALAFAITLGALRVAEGVFRYVVATLRRLRPV